MGDGCSTLCSKDEEGGTARANTAQPPRVRGLWGRAVRRGDLEGMKRLVAKYKIQVDLAANDLGETALHVSARANRTDVVQYLLQRGADFDAVAPHTGDTPLHMAYRDSCLEAVKILLDVGADPDVRNFEGKKPKHYGVRQAGDSDSEGEEAMADLRKAAAKRKNVPRRSSLPGLPSRGLRLSKLQAGGAVKKRRGSGSRGRGGRGRGGPNLHAPNADIGSVPKGAPLLRARSSDLFTPSQAESWKQQAQAQQAEPKKRGFFKEKAFWKKRKNKTPSKKPSSSRNLKGRGNRGMGKKKSASPHPPSNLSAKPRSMLKTSSSRMLFGRDNKKQQSVRWADGGADNSDSDLSEDEPDYPDYPGGAGGGGGAAADPQAAWRGLIGAAPSAPSNARGRTGTVAAGRQQKAQKKDPRKYAESSRVLGGVRRGQRGGGRVGGGPPSQFAQKSLPYGMQPQPRLRERPNAQHAKGRMQPQSAPSGAGHLGITKGDPTQRASFLAMMGESVPQDFAFPVTAKNQRGHAGTLHSSHEYHAPSTNKLKRQQTRKKLAKRALDDNALPSEMRPVLKVSSSGKHVVVRLDILAQRFDEMPNPLSLWDKVVGKAKKFTTDVEDVYRLMHTLAVRSTEWEDSEQMRMLMLRDADQVAKQFKRGKKFVIKRQEFANSFPHALRVVHDVQQLQQDNFRM